ncbi:hypothetical protein DL93DRAFT_940412 [Clavulina sp. PMI_390]|nr:hypothetical protein DL93DRAFT_940412 [Clavulina sp. PMI_390]
MLKPVERLSIFDRQTLALPPGRFHLTILPSPSLSKLFFFFFFLPRFALTPTDDLPTISIQIIVAISSMRRCSMSHLACPKSPPTSACQRSLSHIDKNFQFHINTRSFSAAGVNSVTQSLLFISCRAKHKQ